MHEHVIGKSVLLRSSPSGVWAGRLEEVDGRTYRLEGARRLWSWEGAGECSQLATVGPESGQIGPQTDVVVHDVCECQPMTDAAVARVAGIEPWTK